jgi:hypothetical protein
MRLPKKEVLTRSASKGKTFTAHVLLATITT